MSGATYFLQACPTCGRRARISIDYLGRRVVCLHCSGNFEARDPATTGPAAPDAVAEESPSGILRRANELLALSATSSSNTGPPTRPR